MTAKRKFSVTVKASGLPPATALASPLHEATNSAKVEPTAVELLKDMLARVERGEVTFVAVVGQTPDGCVVDGWSSSKACRPFTIVGALTYIAQKFAIHNID